MRLLAYGGLISVFFSYFPHLALASVLAIDYGSDFIKASLMKPGVPFDVLLNKDSKRKINSVVAFKKGEVVWAGCFQPCEYSSLDFHGYMYLY